MEKTEKQCILIADDERLNRKNLCELLESEYEKRYNKVLTGKQLEQFHTDFQLEGAVSEIYATKSIFLGKKSYIDVLESTNIKGKTITGTHIRLKGITKEGIEYSSKEYSKNNTPEYFKFFEDLSLGVSKSIILNPLNPETNKKKVMFDFNKGSVSTRGEFRRIVQF